MPRRRDLLTPAEAAATQHEYGWVAYRAWPEYGAMLRRAFFGKKSAAWDDLVAAHRKAQMARPEETRDQIVGRLRRRGWRLVWCELRPVVDAELQPPTS